MAKGGELTKLKDSRLQKVKKQFDAASKSKDYYARSYAFAWTNKWQVGSQTVGDVDLYLFSRQNPASLTDFIGLPSDVQFDTMHARTDVADAEFHMPKGLAGTLDEDLAALSESGKIVGRYLPKFALPNARRSAGAVLIIDYENDEALFLYGRAGSKPTTVNCTATEMHSAEFDAGFAIDGGENSSANVLLAEVPLLGDVFISVGSTATFSNSSSTGSDAGYGVSIMQTGDKIIADAGTADTFLAKLVVDGNEGTLYGDKKMTHSPVKAATLSCQR